MEELNTSYRHPFHPTRGNTNQSTTSRDDWEDWEVDEPVTPIGDGAEPLIEVTSASPTNSSPNSSSSRTTTTKALQSRVSNAKRQSVQKLSRLKSRRRLQGQNAKAGITLDTDLAKYRHQQQLQQRIANQMSQQAAAPEPTRGKFVDAAALKALEGSPSTATVGSFHWLRMKGKGKGKEKATALDMTPTPVDQGLSPEGLTPNNKIMIGIELPEGSERAISPQTAVVGTPLEFPIMLAPTVDHQGQPIQRQQPPPPPQVSVWSPDTEYTNSAYPSSAGASSLQSYYPFSPERQDDVPPVPVIPANAMSKGRRRTTVIEDDIDLSTPVTLFEEGSPITMARNKSFKSAKTPLSASRSQGWWDQILSPFVSSPAAMSPDDGSRQEREREREQEWWRDSEEKNRSPQERSLASSRRQTELSIVPPPRDMEKQGLSRVVEEAEGSPPTVASSSSGSVEPRRTDHAAAAAAIERAQPSAVPSEAPPPYSPPNRNNGRVPVRFRAVFPPGHELNAVYPPSPGPLSPTMPGTMTSQGAINMTEVPLTPAPLGAAPLPPRPIGSFVPGEHFLADLGRGDRQKAEKQRRRHEKEDRMARRAGGFWRGRWCLPAAGCFGRPGREGRKRRRVCCGVLAGVTALVTLVVVLAVVLTRKHAPAATEYSPWLNLTDFPPMPMGVSTVVGEDNAVVNQACVNPPTLWQCSLPKELAAEAAPFEPDQPRFIFQVQVDNSSSQAWNVTGQQPPASRRSMRRYASGFSSRSRPRDTATSAFNPDPAPPTFQEMFFLGNTTDGIESAEKAGEPTPFYITLLSSLNATVGPNSLSRRAQGTSAGLFNTSNFPVPDLNADGTGAPARLLPRPVQQPVRLYDRGLPTEHYGFYTYFNRTIYVKSVATVNSSTADLDGGSLETEANFLLIWAQTRMKVEIFTRLSADAARFVGGNPLDTTAGSVGNDTRPGSMPYPVAVTLDTHGGDPARKGTWAYRVTDRQQIDVGDFLLVANDVAVGGVRVNPANKPDLSLGGVDGGTGGCQCVWRNFVGTNGGN